MFFIVLVLMFDKDMEEIKTELEKCVMKCNWDGINEQIKIATENKKKEDENEVDTKNVYDTEYQKPKSY